MEIGASLLRYQPVDNIKITITLETEITLSVSVQLQKV